MRTWHPWYGLARSNLSVTVATGLKNVDFGYIFSLFFHKREGKIYFFWRDPKQRIYAKVSTFIFLIFPINNHYNFGFFTTLTKKYARKLHLYLSSYLSNPGTWRQSCHLSAKAYSYSRTVTNSAYAKNNRVDLLYRLVFCDSVVWHIFIRPSSEIYELPCIFMISFCENFKESDNEWFP